MTIFLSNPEVRRTGAEIEEFLDADASDRGQETMSAAHSSAGGEMTQAGETEDIVDAVLEDHARFRTLFAEFDEATGEQREETWQMIVRGLAVHETAEEMIVHPQVRRLVDGGDDMVDARVAEEDAAKKKLADLEGLGPGAPEFDAQARELFGEVLEHAEEEEREELPELRAVTDEDARRRMGRLFDVAEAFAPTHAHKTAPESATGNIVAGPVVALMDRVRDAIRDAMAQSNS